MHLTESDIQRLTWEKTYRRGETYYARNAVRDIVLRERTLYAEVQGSRFKPYRVRIEFDAAGIAHTFCSCPQGRREICKHVVATLLTYVRKPDRVRERPSLPELLATLDRETLQNLLLDLASDDPYLVEWIDSRIELLRARKSTEAQELNGAQKRPPIDAEAIRRHVQYILRTGVQESEYDIEEWQVDDAIDGLYNLLQEVQAFVEAGDGENALRILEVMLDVLEHEVWMPYTERGWDFLKEMGQVLIEAILTADLSVLERKRWVERLQPWAREMADYGDESFTAAMIAAKTHWNDPALQRMMRGEVDIYTVWGNVNPLLRESLIRACLNVLERQERIESFLNLARAAYQTERYVTKLIQLKRYDEALNGALQHLNTPWDALSVAKAFRAHGQMEAALQVADYGLRLGVYGWEKRELAVWLREFADSLGRKDIALDAAIQAFRARACLEEYRAVEQLAGDRWTRIRAELLQYLRQSGPEVSLDNRVDIFLYEDMIDDAIDLAERSRDSYLIDRVVDAVWQRRPEWTIRTCLKMARTIIEEKRSEEYEQAVRWLEKALQAAVIAGQFDRWRTDVENLRRRHQRKYKLVPMLDALLTKAQQMNLT